MAKFRHLIAAAAVALAAFPASAAAWGPWSALGRPGTSALSAPVTAVPLSAGRFAVFGVGQDGQVAGRTWRGSAWGPWGALGKPAAAALSAAAPVAAVGAGNRVALFAVGQDGRAYARGSNGGWKTIGRPAGSPLSGAAPITTRVSAGRISLFALGQDGALYMHTAVWVELGRPAATPLAPSGRITWVSRGSGQLAVFVAGQDGRLYVRSFSGRWHPWGVIDPPPGVAISTGISAQRTTLWAVTQDGQLFRRARTDGAWEALGRPAEAPLSASTRIITIPGGPLHYDVLALAQDGRLYGRAWTSGAWGPWTAVGDPPPSPLTAGPTFASGQVLAVGQDGGLYSISIS